MATDTFNEMDPAEAATVETSQEPSVSVIDFARIARAFGFRIINTLDDANADVRALEMAHQLMPRATDRERQRFVEGLLANVAPGSPAV